MFYCRQQNEEMKPYNEIYHLWYQEKSKTIYYDGDGEVYCGLIVGGSRKDYIQPGKLNEDV